MTNGSMKKRATWSVAFLHCATSATCATQQLLVDKYNHKVVALLSNIVHHKLDLTFVQKLKLEILTGFLSDPG